MDVASMPLQQAVEAARREPGLVLLEGVHALKHAVRFGAVVERVVSPEPVVLLALLDDLAPDVTLPVAVEPVADPAWDAMTGGGLPSPSLAFARRPVDTLDAVMATRSDRPVVALEDPTHLGNVGAVVRVSAAAGAAGVVVVGSTDPWHPRAVRGGAGLQFALPVGRREALVSPTRPLARPVVALDPAGDLLGTTPLPAGAVLAFGTERHGLTDDLLGRADRCVRLPMRAGVSSLNLATAVAATLYGLHAC